MASRRRRIFITSVLIATSFLLISWLLWDNDPKKQYIPGEDVEGVTKGLQRSIPDNYNPVKFKDVTGKSGINFQHFNDERTSQLPEDMGSGAAWLDYNNDGWDDLFVVNFAGSLNQHIPKNSGNQYHCTLFRNNRDGSFTEVSREAGINLTLRGMGVAVADYNNDGHTDILITTYGRNHLLKNNGDGTFSNVSHQAGLGDKEGFWAGASWGDYDRDGDLDLYITGYVKYIDYNLSTKDLAAEEPPSINPSSFRPIANIFYKNNGNGTFTEITRQAGIANASGRSLSATWTDFNNDLWPDLYVANDVSDNVLYLNKKNGTFEDISHNAYVADYRGAMGIASGDWDNDLDMDLFITHWIAQENALYTNLWNQNSGNRMQFADESDKYGLGQSSLDYIAWATSFVDLDLDGRQDLFVVNGSTFQYSDNPTELKPMPDQVYWNAGSQKGFFDVSKVSGPYFQKSYVGRGGAFSDYDRDGDPDLFIVNHNGRGVLLKNENTLDNNWLSVSLEGSKSNRSAIGAQISIVTGDLKQTRQVGAQSSYLSQNSRIQHFGTGKNNVIDSLKISWPSGNKDTYVNIKANQIIHILEGDFEISILHDKNLAMQ